MGNVSAHSRKAKDGALRSARLEVRLSPGEKTRLILLAKSARMTMSDYVLRRTLYDAQPIWVFDARALQDIARELSRQGNNLNQAAHALNAALANPNSPRYLTLLEDGARSVARQQESRLATYRALDDAITHLFARALTKREL